MTNNQNVSFINAEAHVDSELHEKTKDSNESQVFESAFSVLISFGNEQGPVEDRRLSLRDARDLVGSVLNVLSEIGDPTAQKIVSVVGQIIKNESEA